MMLPSKFENIFLTFEIFSFFTIAAIDGPFPETEAPNAPLSIKSTIILGSEFSIEDVANPFIVIASQYFFSLANSHALLKIDDSIFNFFKFPLFLFFGIKIIALRFDGIFSKINESKNGVIVFINQPPNPVNVLFRLNEIKNLQSKGEYKTPPVKMDEKDFGIGAQILHDLKIHKIRLLTNSTQIKRVGMIGYGLEIVEYINY